MMSHFRTVMALPAGGLGAHHNLMTPEHGAVRHIPLTMFSVIFLASPSSIMVLSR